MTKSKCNKIQVKFMIEINFNHSFTQRSSLKKKEQERITELKIHELKNVIIIKMT